MTDSGVGPVSGRAVGAGLVYFALTFAAGFALGTIRTLAISPRVGELAAVIVECPVMLNLAWIACGWTVRRCHVPAIASERLVMGVVAFATLILAEAGVGIALFGRTVAEHIGSYARPAAQVGLAAQIVYAAFPLMRRAR